MMTIKKTSISSAGPRAVFKEAFDFQHNGHTKSVFAPTIPVNKRAAPTKILIISHHPGTRSALRKELQAAHYDVIAGENAAEGIYLAAAVQPGLILLDMTGPLTEALGASKSLKNNSATRPIPIIFLTTVDRAEEIIPGSGLDTVDYVVKPYRPKELRTRIRTALALRDEKERFHQEILQFKSRFVSRLSNELRNHVTVIAGFASLLEQKPGCSAPLMSYAYLQEIIHQVNHLSDLTEGFEGLFQTGPDFEEVGVVQILQATIEKFRHRLERKGQHLALKFPPQDPLVLRGNRHDLFSAFSYLLSNAHRFTAAGGTITVQVLSMDHQARIEITHTGIGLSPEPAGQESLDGETSPLGLTIARSIAERHDGGLGVENQPGQGGRFWMILPLNRYPAESKSRSGSSPAVSSTTPFPRG
jgi:signal transduction histidine kinase